MFFNNKNILPKKPKKNTKKFFFEFSPRKSFPASLSLSNSNEDKVAHKIWEMPKKGIAFTGFIQTEFVIACILSVLLESKKIVSFWQRNSPLCLTRNGEKFPKNFLKQKKFWKVSNSLNFLKILPLDDKRSLYLHSEFFPYEIQIFNAKI